MPSHYRRHNDSSGFEHVFVGEERDGKVMGMYGLGFGCVVRARVCECACVSACACVSVCARVGEWAGGWGGVRVVHGSIVGIEGGGHDDPVAVDPSLQYRTLLGMLPSTFPCYLISTKS